MNNFSEQDRMTDAKVPWMCCTPGCINTRLSTSTRCMTCIQNAAKSERNAVKAASKPAPAPLKRSTRVAKKASPESLAGLKLEAQKVFNAFIRERDKDLPCIYCSKPVNSQDLEACHFYPVSTSESLRYFEGNVFGGHRICNMQDDRGAIETNVLNRIGEEEFTNLQRLKSSFAKFSTETLEMIIENYTKPKETIMSAVNCTFPAGDVFTVLRWRDKKPLLYEMFAAILLITTELRSINTSTKRNDGFREILEQSNSNG